MKRLSLRVTILAAAAFAACTGSASAQTCSGTLASGTYTYQTLTVPAKATCTLPAIGSVTVTNNVEMEMGQR
jgi:hypothetical protein